MPDTIKITNAGELKYFNNGMRMNQRMLMFTNNLTVADTHVMADFTKPTYSGYADKDMNNWPAASTNAGGRAASTHPDVSFDYTALSSAVTIRGIALYDPVDNQILAVVKYEFPETLSGNGSHIVAQTLQQYSAT